MRPSLEGDSQPAVLCPAPRAYLHSGDPGAVERGILARHQCSVADEAAVQLREEGAGS